MSSSTIATGVATGFLALAVTASFFEDPRPPRAGPALRGTIAPDVSAARLPAAPKRA